MRKKILECDIHGKTLFRCKRKCWKRGGKDKAYADEYIEQCFKCIEEGRYSSEDKKKRKKHVSLRS